jgi:transposase-like protein
MIAEFKSLYDLFAAIPDEQAAINYFKGIRWKTGEFCPYCGHDKIYPFSDGKTWKCAQCRDRFSIRVGTVFEDSKIPIRKWLAAIWFITSHKKGIASTALAKDLNVTQKTAWFMLHRLRHAARTRSFNRRLDGRVEIDETFVGGKAKNRHIGKRGKGGQTGGAGKAIVLGMLERGGELRTMHVADLKAKNLQATVDRNVNPGAAVITDEYVSYHGLDAKYQHHTINHSQGEYVRDGFVHTNSIEGVWALLKRQIYGIHHFVSSKHLHRYISEATWRFNRRNVKDAPRMVEFLGRTDGRLRYRELIAKV